MPTLLRSLLVSLVLASPLAAQPKTVAERLGHPADAKLLILHADDLAVAHSVNTASLDALASGAVSSASIMVPTPWLTEVATWARAHPTADLGLHLTVTAEWETYRWGSVAPADNVPTLLDPDGTFPRETRVVAARAKVSEVERELRAQIDRAIAVGIRPTHVDAHMGTLFSTTQLMAAYVKVAREYKLPFLGTPGEFRSLLSAHDIVPDAVVAADAQVPRDKWAQFYLETIAKLKPGLTEMIVHLGHDDAELQAVMVNHEPYGATWRQRDYDVVRSAAFKQALKDHGVILVTWRDVQKAVYGPLP